MDIGSSVARGAAVADSGRFSAPSPALHAEGDHWLAVNTAAQGLFPALRPGDPITHAIPEWLSTAHVEAETASSTQSLTTPRSKGEATV
ncbi:hypothetical protein [Amycolatopsis sp. Hca4]|uniref:hypothetical protein n=1 Tax=Amycolatopsis sp. Hca4 TaxID=2742131 RepID=UPI001590BC0B|nr:hypothetical protein [Amycolatopsis sp. Hca4]QKV73907.1 hypothetical protein HUT10_09095 [Amycolatopsis sp. Hca4]